MTDRCAWPAEAMKSEDRHPEHLGEMLLSVYCTNNVCFRIRKDPLALTDGHDSGRVNSFLR